MSTAAAMLPTGKATTSTNNINRDDNINSTPLLFDRFLSPLATNLRAPSEQETHTRFHTRCQSPPLRTHLALVYQVCLVADQEDDDVRAALRAHLGDPAHRVHERLPVCAEKNVWDVRAYVRRKGQ
eukprot:363725-Chlamydomonas_euryale.AAC.8